MGVRGLMSYCRPIRQHANMTQRGKTIGIDAYSLLFLFRERRDDFKAYLQGLVELGHTMTFVMDKRAQKEKKEVVDERKTVRAEAKAETTQLTTFTQTDEFDGLDDDQRRVLEKYLELKRRDAWCLYPEYVKWMKGMVLSLGIQIQVAEEEADSVLAKGNYDIVISSDSDLLIHGARVLWIPRGVALQHNEIRRDKFLEFMGLGQEQLYELAFLAGCDVQPKKFLAIDSAVTLLRFYGSLSIIQQKKSLLTQDDLDSFKKLKTLWSQ